LICTLTGKGVYLTARDIGSSVSKSGVKARERSDSVSIESVVTESVVRKESASVVYEIISMIGVQFLFHLRDSNPFPKNQRPEKN